MPHGHSYEWEVTGMIRAGKAGFEPWVSSRGGVLRPKLHGYTGCKRTCSVEQAVSCI